MKQGHTQSFDAPPVRGDIAYIGRHADGAGSWSITRASHATDSLGAASHLTAHLPGLFE